MFDLGSCASLNFLAIVYFGCGKEINMCIGGIKHKSILVDVVIASLSAPSINFVEFKTLIDLFVITTTW